MQIASPKGSKSQAKGQKKTRGFFVVFVLSEIGIIPVFFYFLGDEKEK